jgi:hypothetical protein
MSRAGGTGPARRRRAAQVPVGAGPGRAVGYPGGVPRPLTTWLVIAVACIAPATAAAAIPNAQTDDPLERAVVLSLGSIYRVETTVSVVALRTRTGRTYPLGRIQTVTELGTAFAVAPSGVVVTDAHVAAPFGAALAVAAAPLALAQVGQFGAEPAYEKWVNDNGVVPVGVRVLRVRVWRASASATATANPVDAHVIPGSVENGADLALLQLSTRNVPALLLNEGETIGTAAAAIGYGVGTSTTLGLPGTLVPGVKTGTIGPTGVSRAAPGQPLTLVNAPITRGDSGAPVIDSEATAHGIVRFKTTSGGAMEQSQAIFNLLQRQHITNSNGTVFTMFQRGMDALWAGHYAAAAAAFAETARLDPTHPLAAALEQRSAVLARAKHPARHPRWWRPMFIGIAALAVLGLLFGVRRLRALRQGRPGGDPDGFPAPH